MGQVAKLFLLYLVFVLFFCMLSPLTAAIGGWVFNLLGIKSDISGMITVPTLGFIILAIPVVLIYVLWKKNRKK